MRTAPAFSRAGTAACHTLWQVGIAAGLDQHAGSIATFLEELDVEALPHLAEHVEQHLQEHTSDDEGEFAFGLDLILDGLGAAKG
jgi:hypothetical protein